MVYLVGGTRRSEQTLMGPSSHKVRSGKTHDLNGQGDFTATGALEILFRKSWQLLSSHAGSYIPG